MGLSSESGFASVYKVSCIKSHPKRVMLFELQNIKSSSWFPFCSLPNAIMASLEAFKT